MDATESFQNLLQRIKSSSLNYRIEESPFSATISLKNSYIKDRYGNQLIQSPTSNLECLALIQKNLHLEEVIKTLKSDYETTLNDCEKTYKEKGQLENKIEVLSSKLAEVKVEKVDSPEVSYLKSKLEEIAAQNVNYRNEIKSINVKHEKVIGELKYLKNENETLQKEKNSMSVSLKSAKKDLKDNYKMNEQIVKKLEDENRKLEVFKAKQIAEAREIKKKEKKLMKAQKKQIKKKAEAKISEVKKDVISDVSCLDQLDEIKEELSIEPPKLVQLCNHFPQCFARQSHPPPHGPNSLKQHKLKSEVIKTEAIQSFFASVLEFVADEPGDTIDIKIAKVEALKKMLEPEDYDDGSKPSEFDEILEFLQTAKTAYENLEDDDYTYDTEGDEDLPPHYWGGEDANEQIFYDDENQELGE